MITVVRALLCLTGALFLFILIPPLFFHVTTADQLGLGHDFTMWFVYTVGFGGIFALILFRERRKGEKQLLISLVVGLAFLLSLVKVFIVGDTSLPAGIFIGTWWFSSGIGLIATALFGNWNTAVVVPGPRHSGQI